MSQKSSAHGVSPLTTASRTHPRYNYNSRPFSQDSSQDINNLKLKSSNQRMLYITIVADVFDVRSVRDADTRRASVDSGQGSNEPWAVKFCEIIRFPPQQC